MNSLDHKEGAATWDARDAHEITDLLESPLFTAWTDPQSGVVSYILTPADGSASQSRVAPLQQSFYYVNPSLSADGRYYWFYCAFPPANSASTGRCLGVVDFLLGSIHWFPETAFSEASPMLDPVSGDVYWANGSGIWTRSADPLDRPRFINAFSYEITRGQKVNHYATHLTLSADRRFLNVDSRIGTGDYVIGRAPLDGSDIEIWQRATRLYNHGQFNPRDPDIILLAQENGWDSTNGAAIGKDNRLWTIRRGGELQAVYPRPIPAGPNYSAISYNPHLEVPIVKVCTDPRQMHGHEWWSADGGSIWYIHYKRGVERVALSAAGTEEAAPELMWPHITVSHAHTDSTCRYIVLDALPPDEPDTHHISFVNLDTSRSVDIVSHLPCPPRSLRRYHIHAHPQFCGNDRLICYTTTVLGGVDVAFTRVSDLIQAT